MKSLQHKLALIFLVLYGSLAIGLAAQPSTALAASDKHCSKTAAGFLDFPTWYKFLDPQFVNGECQVKLRGADNRFDPKVISKILLAVFEILLRVAGLAAFIFMLYGGYQYLTSQGEPDKAKAARTTIVNAVVGMIVATMSVVIVNLVAWNIL